MNSRLLVTLLATTAVGAVMMGCTIQPTFEYGVVPATVTEPPSQPAGEQPDRTDDLLSDDASVADGAAADGVAATGDIDGVVLLEESAPEPTPDEIAAAEAAAAAADAAELEKLAGLLDKSATQRVIKFHLPRSLVLITLSDQNNGQTLGAATAPGEIMALSVPTDMPIRRRVETETIDIDDLAEEDQLVDLLDPLDPDGVAAETVADAPPLALDPGEESAPAEDGTLVAPEDSDVAAGDDGEVLEEEQVFQQFSYEEVVLPLYTMRPMSERYFQIDSQIAYFENTRLISSIGANVAVDQPAVMRTESRNLIALANTAPVYFSDLPQPEDAREPQQPDVMPTAIDVQFYLDELAEKNIWAPLPFNEEWSYRIDVSDVPPDAVRADIFFKGVEGRALAIMPVAACRTATLYLVREQADQLVEKEDISVDFRRYIAEQAFYKFNLRIADPTYVQTVILPREGQIVMHDSCGADVKTVDYKGGDERVFISQAGAQARAVIDAWQKVLKR